MGSLRSLRCLAAFLGKKDSRMHIRNYSSDCRHSAETPDEVLQAKSSSYDRDCVSADRNVVPLCGGTSAASRALSHGGPDFPGTGFSELEIHHESATGTVWYRMRP